MRCLGIAALVWALASSACTALHHGLAGSTKNSSAEPKTFKTFKFLTEEQKNRSTKVWESFMRHGKKEFMKLPIHAAEPDSTDRVALTILQPATPEKIAAMAPIVRLNMHRLGPTWALQIFYAQESEKKELDKLLGHPDNVIWSPIKLNGKRIDSLGRFEFSYWLLDMDFWNEVRPNHEHNLIFGDDSIVLKGNGCIEKFLAYDYVGAPWHDIQANMPRWGGNGGFSLRRRSKSIHVINDFPGRLEHVKAKGPKRQAHHEDEAFVKLFHATGGLFPSRQAATEFCVETIFNENTCSFHKPWLYQDAQKMRRLLAASDPL